MKTTLGAIKQIMARWRPRLGIDSRWDIEVRLYEPGHWPKKFRDAVACIEVNPGYFTALLRINREATEEDGHTLEHIVLHELVHIVVWPLSILAHDGLGERHEQTWTHVMEALTEQMTRALLSAQAASH